MSDSFVEAREGMHVSPSEARAYAATLATVVIENDLWRFAIPARIERVPDTNMPRVVLDGADGAFEWRLLPGTPPPSARELHEQTALALDLAQRMAVDLLPTYAAPPAPWERFRATTSPVHERKGTTP